MSFHSDFQASTKNLPPSILKQALYRSHRKLGVPIPELCLISKAHIFHAQIVEATIDHIARKYREQLVLASRRKAQATFIGSIAKVRGQVDQLRQELHPPPTPTPAISSPRLNVPRDTASVPVVPRFPVVPAQPGDSPSSTLPSQSPPRTSCKMRSHTSYISWECNLCRRTVGYTACRAPDPAVRPSDFRNSTYATSKQYTRT